MKACGVISWMAKIVNQTLWNKLRKISGLGKYDWEVMLDSNTK